MKSKDQTPEFHLDEWDKSTVSTFFPSDTEVDPLQAQWARTEQKTTLKTENCTDFIQFT